MRLWRRSSPMSWANTRLAQQTMRSQTSFEVSLSASTRGHGSCAQLSGGRRRVAQRDALTADFGVI